MDEVINEMKQIYLDWYNSNIFTYKGTAKVLYRIGEMIKEME